ncbi:hypothetical protein ACJWDR_02775 [Streptomyces tauricus]|uniref:hypothetical protein n=1 Tax=Streptomyces tauricus TaxID=68274 RepID=UPI00387F2F27
MDAAAVLDGFFADPGTSPRELAARLDGVHVPVRGDKHVTAAVLRAPAARARESGRWLVRHGYNADAVALGLALLAEVATVDDIPRIQTVSLFSNDFGPLAVRALERLPDSVDALIWLAERVTSWGRLHAVEALCRHVDDPPAIRQWLLRRAADGDFLNSYFAHLVARAAGLPEAIAEPGADAELVDHTGRILHVMTYCEGMGTSLRHYPQAVEVMEAHVRHLEALAPTSERYFAAATVAAYLTKETPLWSDDIELHARWHRLRTSYLALTDRTAWCHAARKAFAATDSRMTWLANHGPSKLNLRAFAD